MKDLIEAVGTTTEELKSAFVSEKENINGEEELNAHGKHKHGGHKGGHHKHHKKNQQQQQQQDSGSGGGGGGSDESGDDTSIDLGAEPIDDSTDMLTDVTADVLFTGDNNIKTKNINCTGKKESKEQKNKGFGVTLSVDSTDKRKLNADGTPEKKGFKVGFSVDATDTATTKGDTSKTPAPEIGSKTNKSAGTVLSHGLNTGVNLGAGAFFFFYASKKAKKPLWIWIWRITAGINVAYAGYNTYKAIKIATSKGTQETKKSK